MATYTKISGLTAASALDGTELFEGVQSAAPVKVTAAQIGTYVHANPTGITATSVITGEYIFTEDNELDYSASFVDSMSAGTVVTFAELPATTVAIHAYIEVADTGTDPRIYWKRTAGGTQAFHIFGSWADVGTNQLHGTWWMPTGGNSINVTNVQADAVSTFKILGYKTGA